MKVLIIAFTLLSTLSHAQNLLHNGDFEEDARCQENYEVVALPPRWIHLGTPDMFVQGCPFISPTNNITGICQPYSGKAFAGLSMDLPEMHKTRWLEQLHTVLKEPLKKDSVYAISMYVSLAQVSTSRLGKMSVRLTKEPNKNLKIPPSEIITMPLPDSMPAGEWIHLQAWYKAAGDERWLVIGNFLTEDNFIARSKPKGDRIRCYMYIDNVSIIPVQEPIIDSQIQQAETDTFVLQDINFAVNSYELQSSAYPMLDSIAQYLKTIGNYTLEITGHTDSTGTYAYNQLLSRQRAEVVMNYLVRAGVPADVITAKGMGSDFPVADNNTVEGRSLNRRVELVVRR